ncbi:MAG: NAD(P)H-hydrate epimerase [Candidatus Omnitrophica bacterium]|nr:NAD(P)H-hydrate epimerase [Candidatus Omnitrophota bacterium]
MRYVTASEMKEIDRSAIEGGLPARELMENAGRAVAVEVGKLVKSGSVAVFCGYGNNGGDGFVAARYLKKKGYDVFVYVVGRPRSMTQESSDNLEKLFTLGIKVDIIPDKARTDFLFKSFNKPALVIDALFGTGFRGPLDDLYSDLIKGINALGSTVLAIDIPSGLDTDTGLPTPDAIKAYLTVALGYPKSGFKASGAKEYTGIVVVADIGLPKEGVRKGYKTVKLRSGKSGRHDPRHPWIYKGRLLDTDPKIKPGDIVKVVDPNNVLLGVGYYNYKSDIAVRILSFKDRIINKAFFLEKIGDAFARRKDILETTNAVRTVFSEADSLPGLIVDLYGETAVFQALTLGMDKLKSIAVEAIREVIKPKYIYEKSISPFRAIEDLKEVSRWWGDAGESLVEIYEGNAKFLVDIVKGHKTGFYLDQRKARSGLENISKGKRVLDLFCYTGAFSVFSALYGAEHIRGVDIKDQWLSLARKNAELNGVSGKTEFVKGDGFKTLEKIASSGEKFDVIILDPPSFLRSRASLESASRGYKELNFKAMKVLTDGGVLATFSCSHNMPNALFAELIKKAATEAKKKYTILKRCHQSEDHPIVREIPETEYLKGYFLKVEPL